MLEIVSWNVNRCAVWDELRANEHLDLALLQEAPRPPVGVLTACVPPSDGDWSTTHWPSEFRTCVAQLSERICLVPLPLRGLHASDSTAVGVSRRGTLAVADIYRGEERLLTIVSAYAAWERPPGRDDFIYADASAHRLLSDLSALITGRRDERLLVAGDLNILHGYGEGGDEYWAARYRTVFDRAAALGLRFVGPQSPYGREAEPWPDELPTQSRNVPTFHHSRQVPQTSSRQLDFVFATENIADRVAARALNRPDEWGPSDHCQIAIRVDL